MEMFQAHPTGWDHRTTSWKETWPEYIPYVVIEYIIGHWRLDVLVGAYQHDMYITTQTSTFFDGYGSYEFGDSTPAITWQMENGVIGYNGVISMSVTLNYDGSTYAATLTGTMNPAGNYMSRTFNDGATLLVLGPQH